MARQLLRISSDWTEVLTPESDNHYLYNSSGVSIKVIVSDTAIDTSTIDSGNYRPFTIGGSISQMRADKYAYAKAMVEEDKEVIITTDENKIDILDQVIITKQLNTLMLEMMKLTNRVNSSRLEQIDNDHRYGIFIRQMIYSQMRMSKAINEDSNHILALHKRLYAAERYIWKHRAEWAVLKSTVDELAKIGDIDSRLTKLETSVTSVTAEVAGLTTRLNELVPRVEEAWADYDELVKGFIEPLGEQVDGLEKDFRDLNNSITQLTNEHTPEEIEDAFEALIRHVDEDMVPPITGLKNFLVELCLATQANVRQDLAISTKVDYSDTVLMNPSTDHIEEL